MHVKSTAALCFGLVIFGLAAVPANAQTRQGAAVDGTRYTTVDEDGRRRTTVIVQKRSFLDGGTEVLPGSRPLPNNVMPFGYSPTAVIDRTNLGRIRPPLPGPFDLMGGQPNPYPYP